MELVGADPRPLDTPRGARGSSAGSASGAPPQNPNNAAGSRSTWSEQKELRARLMEEAHIAETQAFNARWRNSRAIAGRPGGRSLGKGFGEEEKEECYLRFLERIKRERANELWRKGKEEEKRRQQAKAAARAKRAALAAAL